MIEPAGYERLFLKGHFDELDAVPFRLVVEFSTHLFDCHGTIERHLNGLPDFTMTALRHDLFQQIGGAPASLAFRIELAHRAFVYRGDAGRTRLWTLFLS